MSLVCELTQRRLPAAIDDDRALRRLEHHLSGCLPCQAEAARYRKMARHLGALSEVHEPAPPGLVEAVEQRITGPVVVDIETLESGTSNATKAAAVVGAIAAAAGTAVVVKMLRSRSAA